MRAGAIISALVHAGVLTWVLFGTPKPFEAADGEPVTVDLVTPEEVPQASKPEPERPPKPEAEKPVQPLIPPRETAVAEKPRFAVVQPQAQSPAPQPAAQPPQPAAQQAQPAAPPPQPAAGPTSQRRAAATPAPPLPQAPAPAAPPQQDILSIFDPANIPKLMDMAPAPPIAAAASPGFDALADTSADLSREEVAAFKVHLKKCLKLPAGVSAARDMRVVMRVFLRPDGALAAEPMLVAAPAAQEGPVMVQAATQALKACQPYALPAEKYNDWKTLDIPVSPRDMTGG
jgi:hypothetical protein